MAGLRIIVAGETLGVWSMDDLRLSDAFVIKAATGLDPVPLNEGLTKADPACIQAVVWWLRRKKEPNLALSTVDLRYGDFDLELEEDAEPADPTDRGESASSSLPATTDGTSTNGAASGSSSSLVTAGSALGMSTP